MRRSCTDQETASSGKRTMTTIIDPDGDRSILVDTKVFLVSSSAMGLASKIWKKLLARDSPFREGSGSRDDPVTFEGDDLESMTILIHAAHLQFDQVPATLSFHGLLDVAIACDKYDISTLIRPWVSKWIDHALSLNKTAKHEGWLLIAWTFGIESLFERASKWLVMNMEMSDSQFFLDERAVKTYNTPQDIFGE